MSTPEGMIIMDQQIIMESEFMPQNLKMNSDSCTIQGNHEPCLSVTRSKRSLNHHDSPNSLADAQFWNLHSHLKDDDGHQYSIFMSFFRIIDNERSQAEDLFYLHGLKCTLIDIGKEEYYSSSSYDRSVVSYILNSSELLQGIDKYLILAYQELLHKSILPAPDRLFAKECSVDESGLNLDYDSNTLVRDEEGNYRINFNEHENNLSIKLVMQPIKNTFKENDGKTSRFQTNTDVLNACFVPRLHCDGEINIDGRSSHVEGFGWYEHGMKGFRFRDLLGSTRLITPSNYLGAFSNSSIESSNCGWYRLSIQLNNKHEIRVTHRFHIDNHSTINKSVILIGPDNERLDYDDEKDFELESLKTWISVRTTSEYTTHWKLSIPKQKCNLSIEATFDHQEFLTSFNQSGLWKGRGNVYGSMNNTNVDGYAFMESHPYDAYALKSLDHFFKRISKTVLKNINNLMPKQSNYEQILNLVGDPENGYLLEGLNPDIFSKTIVLPLRDITDRGGKAWRSYAFMVCIDCVGGNSSKYEHWLSLAELVHVGSLIIDDIEDESNIRRGGPACHLLHGTAKAINAGTAAYFMPLHALIQNTPQLTTDVVLKIYEITFLILRAGHIGQGLDIHGVNYMMDEVVETGDSLSLEKDILCMHRLKSGAPAGGLARMAALIGGGTELQCTTLAHYFQSIGIAFQIIDDVLNLRGFQDNTKIRGEDIMAGKITFPIAKAMNQKHLCDKNERKYVWEIIRSKPTDINVVSGLIELLEKCGSIGASVEYAESLVQDAWNELDKIIPNSIFKLMLRAFGLYILERHY